MRGASSFLILFGLWNSFALQGRAQSIDPSDVLHRLSSAGTEELSNLAEKFSLTQEVNGATGGKTVDTPCDGFDHSARKTLWIDGDGAVDAIETHSHTCRRGFLIVFVGRNRLWDYSGTILLEEHYGEAAEYKVISSLVGAKPAIVVRHNLVDWGTGIQQKNMQIFLLIGTRVRLVFDEPESISIGIPSRSSGFVEKQNSLFRIAPGTKSDPYTTIEETRDSVVNGKSVTQYRNYTWDRRDQKFRAYSSGP